MKFLADDGKVFNTMEECEEYEKMNSEGREIAQLWYDYVTTYNKQGQITEPDRDLENTEQFLYDTCNIINSDDSSFINIEYSCLKWHKIRDYFRFEYGYILPESQGTWRYDWEEMKWVNFNVELGAFKKKWAPIDIHF